MYRIIKNNIFPIIFIFVTAFSINKIHAQSNDIRLFRVSDEKALAAWRLSDKEYQYTGQFVLNSGLKEGESFALFGNDLAAFNAFGDYMVVCEHYYYGSEYFQDFSAFTSKIYYTEGGLSDEVNLASYYWPTCGVGSLGFENQLLSDGNHFIYTYQGSGYLSSWQIDRNGNKTHIFDEETIAFNFSMDMLPDSLVMIAWFHLRHWEDEFEIPIGIYATTIKNGVVLKDSVLIKEYPDSLAEAMSFATWNEYPRPKLTVSNDSTFQLFIASRDSSSILNYLLDENARIKQVQSLPIPGLRENPEKTIYDIRTFNISNYSTNSRAVFIAADVDLQTRSRLENYLYYIDNEGQMIGEALIDTTRYFRGDCFIFKTGAQQFLNPAIVDSEARIEGYTNFEKTSSMRLGLITAIENEQNVQPDKFQLLQNYPNPFNPETTIRFVIPKNGRYTLDIYNATGQRIKRVFDDRFTPREYSIQFQAANLASGVYFYQLSGEGFSEVKKFTILK